MTHDRIAATMGRTAVELAGAGVAPVDDEILALVLREGTTNILRHPSPTAVSITVTADALTITNDGATGQDGTLRGLAVLRDRVAGAGGTLAIGRDGDAFTLRLEFDGDAA